MKMQISLKATLQGRQEQIWRDTIFPGNERMLRASRGLPRLTRDRIWGIQKNPSLQ